MANVYEKEYKLRAVGEDGLNIVVSIPRLVIEKEARTRNMTISEFLKKFRAVAIFNSNVEGIHYYFKQVNHS